MMYVCLIVSVGCLVWALSGLEEARSGVDRVFREREGEGDDRSHR